MNKTNVRFFLWLVILSLTFFPIFATKPTVTIKAIPSIINLGGTSTLTWTSTNAISASINQNIGSVSLNGSLTITPSKNITYIITVLNISGSKAMAKIKITVRPPAPIVTFSSSPVSIYPGQHATLSWTSNYATSVFINQGIGKVKSSGFKLVKASKTKIYTITVKGKGGTVKATTTVTVVQIPPTVTITSSPLAIQLGESSTLSWTSTNATTAKIDNGVGNVALNGSKKVWPTDSTTYTITVSGSGGIASTSISIVIIGSQPNVTLITSPQTILPGEASLLIWQAQNADSVSIDNGIGDVAAEGSVQVTPAVTTAYTITATNAGGTSTASATVTVDDTLMPSAAIHSTAEIITAGQSAFLNWASLHALSVSIDNGIGNVSPSGSLSITPAQTTTYTLSAANQNGTASAQVKVVVMPSPDCFAYMPNSSDDTVSIINTIYAGSVVKTLAVGDQPRGSAVSPDGTRVYIGNLSSHSISVIDTGSNTVVSTIAVGGAPKYLALHPGGRILYATLETASGFAVTAIDTVTGQVLKELDFTDYLGGIAVHPDGSRLYVALYGASKVLVIDTASNEIVSEIPLRTPIALAVSPDGSRLYAILEYSGYSDNVSVVDTATQAVVSSVRVALPNGVSASLLALGLLPDGSKLYVTISDNNGVSVINTSTLAVTRAEAFPGYSPKCLAAHPNGGKVFVLFTSSSKLAYYYSYGDYYGGWVDIGTYPHAYGQFVGYMARTATGKVSQNAVGVAGVTLTITGEGVTRTAVTDADGNFITALKDGTYTITPSKNDLAFSPQSKEITVEQNLTGVNFVVIDPAVAPTVSLSASPAEITAGNTATLSWTSTNTATAEIDHGVGAVPVSGSVTVTPDATTTYTITVSNTVLTATATALVTVSSPPPTVIISASPATIVSGGSSTLTWTTANATSASIDNGIGTVPVNGSQSVSPTETTTYTITVIGSNSQQVTGNATVTVSAFDTSAILTGTVTDQTSSLPLAEVTVSALDASGIPQTTLTGTDGKYTISGLRVGDITVSFTKSGYDFYQQTINIPANTTFELVTQLHQTLVGATLKGVVKDGQTNLPITGATITTTYSGSTQTSTSLADGSYILTGITLGTSATITASYTGYRPTTIQQTFTQAQVYTWDFIIYDASAVATINGKITNAKTLQPEEGVEVTFEGSNQKVTTAADGTFNFPGIPLGEQTFYFSKTDFIDESATYSIDHTPYEIDLIKPSRESVQISIGQSISGVIQDAASLKPLSGAIIRVPGIGVEAVTDTTGNYQLSGLPVGNYPMIIIATNHMALSFMANVDIDETNQADFALIPLANGLIKGTVTDVATGDPVDEASIEIDGSAMLAATSEGDGTYKMIGIPPGTYQILVTHAEYADTSVENVEVQDLASTTIDLQLSKRPMTGALAGRILDNTTGNPVSGATVMVSGTAITTTTDVDGNYRLENVPAGLNDILVSSSGYPNSPRIRAVIADKDLSSPSTISSDIRIDAGNSTVDESVTAVITASEGGDIITKDSRFYLHIFPGTLSADAKITLKDASDGPAISIGDDLPLNPALELEGIKASSVMTQIEIAPINTGDPIPTINGLAGFAIRYSQKDADTFQLDENTAFTYTWDGTNFTALDLRPYEFAVDKVNNIVFSVMDLSKSITGSVMQSSKKVLLKTDPHKSGAVIISGTDIIIKIFGKSLKNTIFPPKPKIKIFDKNELLAVTNAPSVNVPHPNALPLLVIHGFDPIFLWYRETNPNKEGRYRLMLEDIVDISNGVYRPVFVSYNTQAKIASIAQSLSEKILGEFLNQKINFKGLPAEPNNPASGSFPYLDTFGFSMGGLVSRTYVYFNRVNMVHNMTMIGTPNHGVFNCVKNSFENNPMLEGIVHILRPLNFGAADMLDYDDNSPEGLIYNPFLFQLNSSILSSVIAPRGDINLFAGTDESAWLGLSDLLIPSPHDSLVTVKSVFCRPTNSTLASKLSLLKVQEPRSKKYEHTKVFSHANVGKQEQRIREFSEELAKGFSDWTVAREYEDNDPDMLPDNVFVKPTTDIGGYCKSKVKVEYNVWQPDSERQSRDIDRIVLVIYHLDGNGHWHISEPKNGENGANISGNINLFKVEGIQGNSKRFSDNPLILSAVVNFDPNPPKGETGYDPEKDIVKVFPLVIPLRSDKMKVPLDPTKAQFRTPELTE